MGLFPVMANSVLPPDKGPCLEYDISLTSTGAVEVTSIVGPCLNFAPERPVRLGVSIDDENVQVLTVVRKGYSAGDGNRDWEESVRKANEDPKAVFDDLRRTLAEYKSAY